MRPGKALAAKLQIRTYARPFKTSLQTHHGNWSVRRGLILRLETADGMSWGEVAPIAAFGTESDEAAQAFCQALPEQITLSQIQQIPACYPACRFGLESAWEALSDYSERSSLALLSPSRTGNESEVPVFKRDSWGASLASYSSSILLPTGAAALESPLLFREQPATFKWKIGATSIQAELEIFEELISLLPVGSKLRLDANGGLSWQESCIWLQVCEGYGIEFLEQPLPPAQLELMLKLSQRYSTPIALDESVTTLAQFKACHLQGWRDIFVVKAPLAGSPLALREFCQTHQLDLVWSSVFETLVARRYIENYLIAALPSKRATGFGVDHWFSDGWERCSPEQIWERLA